MERAVLTIATGKPVYIDMAVALARSFKLWNSPESIRFILATDQPQMIPSDLSDLDVLDISARNYGSGFKPKLFMDHMSDAPRTLFIDADCLVTGSLDPAFDRFKGKSVTVLGRNLSEGEWFGDIAARCRHFDVPHIPRFVGGIYFFEKGETSRKVFEAARSIEPEYDDLGIVRLRNAANEEPLISLGMALNRQDPVPDDGSIKADAMHFPSGIEVDVFRGKSIFRNHEGAFADWVSVSEARPLIAHFNASFAEQNPYRREALRLNLVFERGWSLSAASAFAFAARTVPESSITLGKDLLRPVYRKVFGYRPVSVSPRVE